MRELNTPDDVYPAIDDLVSELRSLGKRELAAKLQHRVHKVAWTTRGELFDELRKVLGSVGATELPSQVARDVRALIDVLDQHLDPTRG